MFAPLFAGVSAMTQNHHNRNLQYGEAHNAANMAVKYLPKKNWEHVKLAYQNAPLLLGQSVFDRLGKVSSAENIP